MQIGDYFVMEDRVFDHVQSRYITDWTITHKEGGQPVKRRTSIRIYGFRELCILLKQAGFDKFEAYSSLSRDPFEVGSPRLYLLATKQAAGVPRGPRCVFPDRSCTTSILPTVAFLFRL